MNMFVRIWPESLSQCLCPSFFKKFQNVSPKVEGALYFYLLLVSSEQVIIPSQSFSGLFR